MKATGIIRRMDDLGRVVIPKELRRTLKLKEGDPLEIFTQDKMICFKKYEVSADLDFHLLMRLCSATIPIGVHYALYDSNKEYKSSDYAKFPTTCEEVEADFIHEIRTNNGDTALWLVVDNDKANLLTTIQVLEAAILNEI